MRPAILLVLLSLTPPARAGSVYDVSWPADGAATFAAFGLTGAAYAYSNELITPRCPCDRNEVPAFDRWVIGNHSSTAATMSDATVMLSTLGGLALGWKDAGSGRARLEDGMILAESLAITGALTTIAKYTVQRPLPRTYDGEPQLVETPRGYRSFFSGHTAIAAAALSTWAMTRRQRHGAEAWPWVVTGLVTASVAGERIAAGNHFPTDVVAGAAVGTVVGIVVPRLHERKAAPGAAQASAGTMMLGYALLW